MTTTITIATHNIRKDLPETSARRSARMVKGLDAGINAFQEVEGVRRHLTLAAYFRVYAWAQLFWGQHIPVTVRRRRFRVRGAEYVQVHKGIAGVTPHRGLGCVLLKIRGRKHRAIPAFELINCHRINRKPGRHDLEEAYENRVRARVEANKASGVTTVIVGDLNEPRTPEFASNQRVMAHHGLDYVIVVQAANGARMTRASDVEVVDTPSDHHAVCVQLDVSAPEA